MVIVVCCFFAKIDDDLKNGLIQNTEGHINFTGIFVV